MMGIRVHKTIGYGLHDLTYKRGRNPVMTDPRVDWKKFQKGMDDKGEVKWPAFLRWFRKHEEEVLRLYRREFPGDPSGERMWSWSASTFEQDIRVMGRKDNALVRQSPPSPASCVHWDNEYGIPSVMLFVPPECTGWHRYDDSIDYIEETDRSGLNGPRNHYRLLKGSGIYPYNNGMIRFRDPKPKPKLYPKPFITTPNRAGTRADSKGFTMLPASTYNRLVGTWAKGQKPMTKGPLLRHFKEDWRPQVPFSIIALLLWLDVFPDVEQVIDDLRPMLYVTWG